MDNLVTVEYRPKLRACQFYIKANFQEHCTVIDVQDNLIVVSDNKNTVELKFPNSVKHIADSVSGLSIANNSLYFRTRTNPDRTYGSFGTEVILPKSKTSTQTYKPPIKIGEPLKIFCGICLHPLTIDEIYFERVLPLPLACGAEDFFCHYKVPTESLLDPRETDCLYGLYFYKVNPRIFETEILSENIFNCPKCFTWLGLISAAYVQLWNSTTIISDITPMAANDDVAIKDFLSVIQEAITEKYNAVNTKKVLMECAVDFQNGSYIHEYLLIWIMENNLPLFTRKIHKDETNTIELQQNIVCKVLYKHEKSKTDTVKDWLELCSVSAVTIAKNMFTKGLEHLEDMSRNIPEPYRTANNMQISYIRKTSINSNVFN